MWKQTAMGVTLMSKSFASSWSRPRAPDRDALMTLGKFAVVGFPAALAWLSVLSALNGHVPELTVGTFTTDLATNPVPALWELFTVLFVLTAPSVVAGALFLTLPRDSVDRWHRFGKLFGLFMALNIAISTEFVAYAFYFQPSPEALAPIQFIAMWALASIFTPGPYLGTLIAARWAR